MEHVGEDETAFGIGVDDFDGLPRHCRDDVARTLRFAIGHILNKTDGAYHIDFRSPRCERVHETHDAGRSRHVAFHVLHALRRLDREPATVETDAFTDEGDRSDATLAAIPAHHDKFGFMRGALSYAEECTHAELAHPRNVNHFKYDAVGDRPPPLPGFLCGGGIGTSKTQFDALGPLLIILLALGFVAIERIGAKPRTKCKVGHLIGLESS